MVKIKSRLQTEMATKVVVVRKSIQCGFESRRSYYLNFLIEDLYKTKWDLILSENTLQAEQESV